MNDIPDPIGGLGSGLDGAPIVARLLSRPGVQKVPSAKLTLFVARTLIAPDLCAALIEQIDRVRRPSTIADANGDAAYRTSETGDLPADDPAVIAVETLLADLTGLSPRHGEPLQGQRYAVGQEFKGHTDYFEPTGVDFDTLLRCDRQPHLDRHGLSEHGPRRAARRDLRRSIRSSSPKPARVVAWNNRRPDGTLNPATIHHGMKVRSGVKYVITKWYRERPWR